jgi:hypothetical protein
VNDGPRDVIIPKSLTRCGGVDIALSVDGVAATTAKVNVKRY